MIDNLNALSDEKIFKIDNNGNLFILDHDRTQKKQKIGEVDLSTQDKLDLIDKTISLTEIKNIWNEYIYLSEPEKFIQTLLAKKQYTKESGWEQEYQITDDHNITERFLDMARVIEETGSVVAIIENKHAEYIIDDINKTKKNFLTQENKGFQQVKRYCDNTSEENKKKTKTNIKSDGVIIASVYVYDGNYFFNNPNLINNLTHYINYNTPFFKTLNIVYDPSKKYSHKEDEYKEEMTIQGAGLIDFLKVNNYHVIKEIQESYVIVEPAELRKLNRESNPRSEMISKSTTLARDMVKNMIDALREDLDYYATKFTNEKHISAFEGLSFMKSSTNGSGYLYGHGLSLSNGQHSNAAYYYIYKILNGIDYDFFDAPYFKDLKNDIEELKTLLKESKIKLSEFSKRLLLKAKVTEARSKKELNALSISSNKSVGGVDTNITPLVDFIHKINHELYTSGSKLQISVPRIPKMDGIFYIDYEILPLLKPMATSKAALSSFRSTGYSKVEDFKNDIFNLKEEKAKIKAAEQNRKPLESKLEGFNEEIKSVQEGSLIYNSVMERIINLGNQISALDDAIYRFSNFDFDIDEKFYNKTLARISLFSKIFDQANRLDVSEKTLINVVKLSYILLHQSINKEKDLYYGNIDEYLNIAVIYSDYLNSDVLANIGLNDSGVNKNSIYNSGKGVSSEINKVVVKYIKNKEILNNNIVPQFEIDIKDIITKKLLS